MRAATVPGRLLHPLMALGLVASLAGCPKRVVDFGAGGEPATPEALLARINSAESQVYAVHGDAHLVVESPQGKGSLTLFASVVHPSRIHLEQLDFIGRPMGVLVTDGERFGLYDSQEGKYLRGPATPRNLGRFLPLVMPPAELAGVLLGRAPRLSTGKMEMRFLPEKQLFELTIVRGDVKQTLLVQPPSYRVVKSTAENMNAYGLEFGDISSPEATVTFPKHMALDAASARTSLELTWKEVEINKAPDLTLFEMEPPEGIPVIEVDANGLPGQPASP